MSDAKADMEALAYVIDALRQQEQRYRKNHWRVPASVPQLIEDIGFRVTRGHGGPTKAAELTPRHGQSTQSKLVTYKEAAAVLSISIRTLKRRISRGDLTPVRDEGIVRLRRDDLESYIENLTQEAS